MVVNLVLDSFALVVHHETRNHVYSSFQYKLYEEFGFFYFISWCEYLAIDWGPEE